MAGDSTRSVKIFINGKEIENTIKSIRGEYAKTKAELERLTVGSDAYNQKVRELNSLNGLLENHRARINQVGQALGKNNGLMSTFKAGLSDGLGLAGTLTGVGAVASAVSLLGNELSKGATDFLNYSEKVQDMAGVMDISGEAIKEMEDRAMSLTTIVTEGGTKIQTSANDVLEGFKLVAGAKPELLEVEGALEAVTKEAIVLSRASGEDLSSSVNNLTTVMGQYNLEATEATRVINALAAGSKAGAAETTDVTESMKEFGLVAANSNITVEESVGLIETLADKQLKGSAAGTQLRNILTKLSAPDNLPKSAIDGFNSLGINLDVVKDKSLPLEVRLKELSKAQGHAGVLAKAFGTENLAAAQIITENVDKYAQLTTEVTGTTSAYDLAATRSESWSQRIKDLGIWWENVRLTIMKFLADAVEPVVESVKDLIGVFSSASSESRTWGKVMDALGGVIRSIFIVIGWVNNVTATYFKSMMKAGEGTGFFSKVINLLLDFLSDLPATLNAVGAGVETLFSWLGGDFSKNIFKEMQSAFDNTKLLQTKSKEERDKEIASVKASGDVMDTVVKSNNAKVLKSVDKHAKDLSKQRKKAEDDLTKHLENLQDALKKHEDDVAKIGLSETEKGIQAIRDKYAKDIAAAIELENKGVSEGHQIRINLERLMYEELAQLSDDAIAKLYEKNQKAQQSELDQIRANHAERIKVIQDLENNGLIDRSEASNQTDIINLERDQALMQAQTEMLLKHNEGLLEEKNKRIAEEIELESGLKAIRMSGFDIEIEAVNAHYDQLLELARKYIDDQAVIDEIESDRQRNLTEVTFKEKERQLSVMSDAFGQLGNAVTGFINDTGKSSQNWIAFQKAMTIAQIAFDTARAISSIVAASTAGDPYTFIARVATGVATVLANIAKAKKLMEADTPKFQQRKDGGYYDVMGDSDGKRYNAKYIGKQPTGLLPSSPSLVLASEKGPEYFVSNEDLQNPLVASLVGTIEDIRQNRVKQRADGGYVGDVSKDGYTSPADGRPGQYNGQVGSIRIIEENTRVMRELLRYIEKGIPAIVGDEAVKDIQKRYRRLNEVAGGVL